MVLWGPFDFENTMSAVTNEDVVAKELILNCHATLVARRYQEICANGKIVNVKITKDEIQ